MERQFRRALKHVRSNRVDRVHSMVKQHPQLLNWKTASFRGPTLLHVAAFANTLEAATALVQQGADIRARDRMGYTPAMHCMLRCVSNVEQHGSSRRMLELLGERFEGQFPWLHHAICQRDPEVVSYMLKFRPVTTRVVMMGEFCGTPYEFARYLRDAYPTRMTRQTTSDPMQRICDMLES